MNFPATWSILEPSLTFRANQEKGMSAKHRELLIKEKAFLENKNLKWFNVEDRARLNRIKELLK